MKMDDLLSIPILGKLHMQILYWLPKIPGWASQGAAAISGIGIGISLLLRISSPQYCFNKMWSWDNFTVLGLEVNGNQMCTPNTLQTSFPCRWFHLHRSRIPLVIAFMWNPCWVGVTEVKPKHFGWCQQDQQGFWAISAMVANAKRQGDCMRLRCVVFFWSTLCGFILLCIKTMAPTSDISPNQFWTFNARKKKRGLKKRVQARVQAAPAETWKPPRPKSLALV